MKGVELAGKWTDLMDSTRKRSVSQLSCRSSEQMRDE